MQPLTRSLPQGGFADNPDNKYIAASVSQLTGQVVIMRSRMPTTPRTYHHQAVMRPAQLRYWSLCSNDPITERFFHYSIQRARYDHERADLGAYYPAIRYASAAQAERLGCHRPA